MAAREKRSHQLLVMFLPPLPYRILPMAWCFPANRHAPRRGPHSCWEKTTSRPVSSSSRVTANPSRSVGRRSTRRGLCHSVGEDLRVIDASGVGSNLAARAICFRRRWATSRRRRRGVAPSTRARVRETPQGPCPRDDVRPVARPVGRTPAPRPRRHPPGTPGPSDVPGEPAGITARSPPRGFTRVGPARSGAVHDDANVARFEGPPVARRQSGPVRSVRESHEKVGAEHPRRCPAALGPQGRRDVSPVAPAARPPTTNVGSTRARGVAPARPVSHPVGRGPRRTPGVFRSTRTPFPTGSR